MEENKMFRSAFVISFVHVYLVFLVTLLIAEGLNIDLEAFLFASVATLFLTFVMVRYFKITINNAGIRGYNFWGKYKFVRWEDVVEVKPIQLIGLKYIRVFYKSGKRPLWLPLFLTNMAQFRQEIEKMSSHSNPINLFLIDMWE